MEVIKALACSVIFGVKVITPLIFLGVTLSFLIFLCHREKPIYAVPFFLTLGITVISTWLAFLELSNHIDMYSIDGMFSLYLLLFDYLAIIIAFTFGYSLISGMRKASITLSKEKGSYEKAGEKGVKEMKKRIKEILSIFKIGDEKI